MPLRISLVQQFDQQQSETWSLAFSPDGKHLASSDGYALYLWRLDERGTWGYKRSLLFPRASFLCFAPDSKRIAFRDTDENVRLLFLEDGKEGAVLSCPAATDCTFSPDGRWLVTGDTARHILLWDVLTSQSFLIPVRFPRFRDDPWEQEMTLADETMRSFRLTPDGQRLVFLASSAEGYLHICHLNLEEKSLVRQATFPHGSMNLAISPNGKLLAVVVSNHQVQFLKEAVSVYDVESLDLLHVFPQVTDEQYCLLAFSPDSRWLASCKTDGWIDIFSLETWTCETQFAAHPGLSTHASDPIGGLDWSKTGYIATGRASVFEQNMEKADYTIKIWRVEEG